MAIGLRIKDLNVYGYPQLVINQVLEEFRVKKDYFIPCHKHALRLLGRLHIVKLEHVPKSANKMANALASLASTLALRVKRVLSF